MAEYEDCAVGSPGPNSSLTLKDLQWRIRVLVESLGQVRDMVAESAMDMHKTLDRLDGVAHEMRAVNHQLRSDREVREKRKARIDQELDDQTERALTRFLAEHLKPSTPTKDFVLCHNIRNTYPVVEGANKRSSTTQGMQGIYAYYDM